MAKKYSAYSYERRGKACYNKLKSDAFDRYGSICVKCGFSDQRALCIDHIHGGGTKHRKEVGWGQHFYRWLKEQGYPDGFQTLCANCNAIKRHEVGEFGGR